MSEQPPYVHQEWPKWIGGVIYNSPDEVPALDETPEETDKAEVKPRRGRPPKNPEGEW